MNSTEKISLMLRIANNDSEAMVTYAAALIAEGGDGLMSVRKLLEKAWALGNEKAVNLLGLLDDSSKTEKKTDTTGSQSYNEEQTDEKKTITNDSSDDDNMNSSSLISGINLIGEQKDGKSTLITQLINRDSLERLDPESTIVMRAIRNVEAEESEKSINMLMGVLSDMSMGMSMGREILCKPELINKGMSILKKYYSKRDDVEGFHKALHVIMGFGDLFDPYETIHEVIRIPQSIRDEYTRRRAKTFDDSFLSILENCVKRILDGIQREKERNDGGSKSMRPEQKELLGKALVVISSVYLKRNDKEKTREYLSIGAEYLDDPYFNYQLGVSYLSMDVDIDPADANKCVEYLTKINHEHAVYYLKAQCQIAIAYMRAFDIKDDAMARNKVNVQINDAFSGFKLLISNGIKLDKYDFLFLILRGDFYMRLNLFDRALYAYRDAGRLINEYVAKNTLDPMQTVGYKDLSEIAKNKAIEARMSKEYESSQNKWKEIKGKSKDPSLEILGFICNPVETITSKVVMNLMKTFGIVP